ncbi:MAG: transposase [Candidatus Handelsmanbacteria bacterium]|nr:transposase [Candidatus Handelsmanbacteria bacterium]
MPERARRRQFTVSFKLRILQEADACKNGELGALLRREGLYSSHLTAWRRQRDQGLLSTFPPRRRGRPPKDPTSAEVARLRREVERLTRKLAAAETVIDIQKKVSALLGITLASADDAGRP